MVAKIKLTAKTAVKGRFVTGRPVLEYDNQLQTYTEIDLSGGTPVVIPADAYFYIFYKWKKDTSNSPTVDIRAGDGVTVLGNVVYNTLLTTYLEFNTGILKNTTGASLTPRLFAKRTNSNPGGIKMEAGSYIALYAENNNVQDLATISWMVDNIYILGDIGEGISGKMAIPDTSDFLTIQMNTVMRKIIWSSNSGNLMWGWDGLEIGVEEI